MDKIKSLLVPGKQTDDEIMYASGSPNNADQTTQKTNITGQGSHFDHTGNAHLGDPQSTAAEPVHGQPFLSQGNPTGTMAGTTGIRPESNIHNENYRGQEIHTSGTTGRGSTNTESDLGGRSGMTGGPQNTSSPLVDSRQNMPGRYPTGGSTEETVHNPYTVRPIDPRVDGSQQSSDRREHQVTGNRNTSDQFGSNAGGQYSGDGQKGLNVARTQDYSQDDRTTGQSSTDRNYGRDATTGGGGYATGVVDENRSYETSGRTTGTSARPAEYSGTTPSGNNNNYLGAPTGTATGTGVQDDGRGARRGSAINLPPPQGAAAAGLMTEADSSHHSGNPERALDSDFDGRNRTSAQHTTKQPGLLSKVASVVTGGAVGGAAGHQASRGEAYDGRGTSNVSEPAHSGQGGQQGYQSQPYSSTTQGGQGYSDDQGLRNQQETTQQYPQQQNEHHTLRNTVIGAGGAGVAAHEYSEHKDHKAHGSRDENYTGNKHNQYSQNTTTGKHGADTTRETEGAHRFYGEDAALAGAGGVAYTEMAGTGQAQQGKSHKPYTDHEGVSGTHERTGASGPASNTSGPHKSNVLNKLDPRVDDNYSATATTGSRGVSHNVGASDGHENLEGHDRHGNRTAVAGAGMPLGDDAGTRRYTEHAHGLDDPAYAKTSAHSGTNTGGVGSANQKPINLDGVDLPRGNQYGQDVKDPRYGLPMAAAGVTAAEAETLRAHDDDLMAKHAAHDNSDKKSKRRSSLLGFLHRDKNKKYTKEEEAQFDRQEKELNARHGTTGGSTGASHGNTSGYAATNKPLPPNPAQQGHAGQQMNLTDRTRDTTSAPGYSGSMVDERGNPISSHGQTTQGGEIPYNQSQYARDTTPSGNNQNYYGAPSGSATGSGNLGRESDLNDRSGVAGSSAYPTGGAGDGRDYPAGNTTGEAQHTKVLQKDDGHSVLHKKSHVIHPAAQGQGESGYQGGAGTGAGGNY